MPWRWAFVGVEPSSLGESSRTTWTGRSRPSWSGSATACCCGRATTSDVTTVDAVQDQVAMEVAGRANGARRREPRCWNATVRKTPAQQSPIASIADVPGDAGIATQGDRGRAAGHRADPTYGMLYGRDRDRLQPAGHIDAIRQRRRNSRSARGGSARRRWTADHTSHITELLAAREGGTGAHYRKPRPSPVLSGRSRRGGTRGRAVAKELEDVPMIRATWTIMAWVHADSRDVTTCRSSSIARSAGAVPRLHGR